MNVDLKLEQQARPQLTLLHTVSSMAPEQIKAWIGQGSADALKALCGEMKSYRESRRRSRRRRTRCCRRGRPASSSSS